MNFNNLSDSMQFVSSQLGQNIPLEDQYYYIPPLTFP